MSYQKPMVLLNDDLAEGVYAASGTPASGSGSDSGSSSKAYTLSVAGAWDGNINYNISFTNDSEEKVESVTVVLKVNGNVTGIDGGVTAKIVGSTAEVTFNNYGNGLEPKATVGPVYMHVTGSGDFSLE